MVADIRTLREKASFLLSYVRQVNRYIQSPNLQEICDRFPLTTVVNMTASDINDLGMTTEGICFNIQYQLQTGVRWPEAYKDAIYRIGRFATELREISE